MSLTTLTRALSCSALVAGLLVGCSSDPTDGSPGNKEQAGAAGAQEGDATNPVEPAATVCDDRLGAVDVAGDLLVPRDSTCRLEGTTVGGRVTVAYGASLLTQDARFGEGISAHSFDRVVLRGGRAEGRPRNWYYDDLEESANAVDFVFDGGRSVVIEAGPTNGTFYILDIIGRVEVSGLFLDVGRLYCAGNTRTPFVRRISAESPGVLQGQCAGLKNFGQTDF